MVLACEDRKCASACLVRPQPSFIDAFSSGEPGRVPDALTVHYCPHLTYLIIPHYFKIS